MSGYLRAGRFSKNISYTLSIFGASISVDKILYKEDIMASIVHAKMLSNRGIITNADSDLIVSGLEKIRTLIENDKFVFKIELEDIHMNIESALAEIIGADVAGKLHTARSRNDQIATDVKLFTKSSIDEVKALLVDLQRVILKLAKANYDTVMPGFTHLQVAQPITFGHHIMAYYEMFNRDKERFLDAKSRVDFCPLGSAALAGTSFPIDRHFVAEELGFSAPTNNSIDSVSDRDFIMEFLSCASICSVHLSRISEELVHWSSVGMNFVCIPEQMTTGSSIMPQKRNPDAAELVRAKSGQIISAMNSVCIVMKGLPLAYSKDMQEDKEPFFRAVENLKMSILVTIEMLDGLKVNKVAMNKMAGMCYSTATDVADWLVRKFKIPFRESHQIVGSVIKFAEKNNLSLSEIPLRDLRAIDERFSEEVFSMMGVRESVLCKSSYGGTSPLRVADAIENAKAKLGE